MTKAQQQMLDEIHPLSLDPMTTLTASDIEFLQAIDRNTPLTKEQDDRLNAIYEQLV